MDIKPYKYLSMIYDADWGPFAERYADFVLSHIDVKRTKNMHMLDLACGTGVLAMKLSPRVASVLGIDHSREMIEIARSKVSRRKNVAFKCGDMRRLKCKLKFDLCTCSFDSINYILTYSDLLSVFRRVYDCLIDGGLFIFDSNTEVHYTTFNGMSFCRETKIGQVTQSVRYVPSRKRNIVTFNFPGGRCEKHIQRPYNLHELTPRLKKAGFKIMSKCRSMKCDQYTARAQRIFIVAKKV